MHNWLEVLYAYHNGKFEKYHYGLTPRLLIGASRIPIWSGFKDKEEALSFSKTIFEEMKAFSKDGLIVSFNDCDINNGIVLKLSEPPRFQRNIELTFDLIWDRYGEEICNGEFGASKYDISVIDSLKV